MLSCISFPRIDTKQQYGRSQPSIVQYVVVQHVVNVTGAHNTACFRDLIPTEMILTTLELYF